MARIGFYAPNLPSLHRERLYSPRCYSRESGDKEKTPRLLKIVVSGVTEVLRLFSTSGAMKSDILNGEERYEPVASSIDEALTILKSDYENAYFVTGTFTSSLYTDDCIFEDPTIRFRGKDLYERNLKLLVPFFDDPSIVLQTITKGTGSESSFLIATWKLRTYLKLPWRPLISIDGSTVYDLDEAFKIIRHAESWNVSALEALGQIFTPSSASSGNLL